MNKDPKELFPRLAQIGVVVRNLEASMKHYESILGIKPYRVIERSPTAEGKKYYYGKESDFYQKAALYQLGDIEFELLEPFGGDSVLSDYLAAHGEGIHHIAFDTGDFKGVREHFEELGIPLAQTGPTSRHPALRWAFFDTVKDLGTTVEVFNAIEVARIEEGKTQ
jgi:catechol 2,3-dioxygenase-like lactoylglutathione lyase family enzyme